MKAMFAVAAVIASSLLATGTMVFSSSSSDPLECEDVVEGDRFESKSTGALGRMEIRFDADSRVRAEVKIDGVDAARAPPALSPAHGGEDGGSGGDAQGGRREARVELCGFVLFEDTNGNGELDDSDSIIQTTQSIFGPIDHATENGRHVLVATTVDGALTVSARIAVDIPAQEEPLIRWSVTANPACLPGATHFAVKLEQRSVDRTDAFLTAACGETLTADGEA